MGEREVGDTGIKSMEGLVEAMRVVSQKAEESAGRELGVGDLQSLAFGLLIITIIGCRAFKKLTQKRD